MEKIIKVNRKENIETDELNGIKSSKNLLFENQIVPELIPTRLAASILGISENALRIKVCRGLVPAYKFGRNLRFRVSEISSLLQVKE